MKFIVANTDVHADLVSAHFLGLGNAYAARNVFIERPSSSFEDHFRAIVVQQGDRLWGGVGLYTARGSWDSLPMAKCSGARKWLDHELQAARSVAELSGLWVDPALRGSDLSFSIMDFAVAVAEQSGTTHIVGFGHERVLPLYGRVGLLPAAEDPIFYPDERYASQLLLRRTSVSHARSSVLEAQP